MLAFLAFLVPKVYLGVKKICKKFHKVPTLGCDLLRVTVLTIFSEDNNAVTAVPTDDRGRFYRCLCI